MDPAHATAHAPTRDWVDVCATAELPPDSRRVVRTPAGGRVAVFRLGDGAVRAVDDVCPHEGYPLSRGEVAGEAVTCCWHNFRFDLRSGACLKGDEAVSAFPARIRADRVEIDLTPPDPTLALAARWRGLEEAVLDGRVGQAARELARLDALGASPVDVARWIARFDSLRGEWGSTHILPVVADLLRWRPRHEGEDRALVDALPFELAADFHVRRPLRPRAAPVDPGPAPDAASARLRALVEARDADGAEALLRGALAKGWGRDVVEPWLFAITCDHFVDIGHHLIYHVKAFELLDVVGWAAADEVLSAMLLATLNGTRHDTLPTWRHVAPHLDAVSAADPRLAPALAGEGRRDAAAREALVAALSDPDRAAALAAPIDALRDGVALATVLEALVLAAAERVLRFDLAHDDDTTLSDGWLDVTHAFTYASALRQAAAATPRPRALLRHVVFAARYVHALSGLDGPVPEGAELPAEARAEAESAILRRPAARPIVLAHLVKMATTAYDEADATADPRPLAALARLCAAPMRQRALPRLVHEARRLVVEGKVPRTRL